MNQFVTEILEQPESLAATLDYYLSDAGRRKLVAIRDLIRSRDLKRIIFTGMGSSYFTSYAASCLFNSFGIDSCAVNTNELLYYHFSLISKETLVVCVSQSGESVEIVKLLEKLPGGISCIGITNEEGSSLAGKATESLLSRAGLEKMTSTKTYTSMLLVKYILGWYLADQWNEEKVSQVKETIKGTREIIGRYMESISSELNFLGAIDFIQFIGRGPSYATALQSELMFKEAAKIPASGTMGGEFRHGPMEMIKPGFKSMLFVAEGGTYSQSVKMASDISRYHGKVLMVTDKDPNLHDANIRVITTRRSDEFQFGIQSIIPAQLMVNELGLANGYTPGNFTHGGKVTKAE